MSKHSQPTTSRGDNIDYMAEFAKLSDRVLIARKMYSYTHPVWVLTHAAYEEALTQEILRRGLELPAESEARQ